METRYFDVRATNNETRTVAGYAAVFGQPSVLLYNQFREQIERGAFAGSLKDDVRAFWNHDDGIVLGRTTSGTLRLAEDAYGLRVEIDMPRERPDLFESIERGDVNQMSFGFDTLLDAWDKDADGVILRTLRSVKLYEVSPVTFPAYPQTEIAQRSDALGDKPEIPAHLTQDESGSEAESAQALLAERLRRLDLADIEF